MFTFWAASWAQGWNVEHLIADQKSSQAMSAQEKSQDKQQDASLPSAHNTPATSGSDASTSPAGLEITERDLEGYQRVQQLFELAMRGSGSKSEEQEAAR